MEKIAGGVTKKLDFFRYFLENLIVSQLKIAHF